VWEGGLGWWGLGESVSKASVMYFESVDLEVSAFFFTKKKRQKLLIFLCRVTLLLDHAVPRHAKACQQRVKHVSS
jgi:hypothetical protein